MRGVTGVLAFPLTFHVHTEKHRMLGNNLFQEKVLSSIKKSWIVPTALVIVITLQTLNIVGRRNIQNLIC